MSPTATQAAPHSMHGEKRSVAISSLAAAAVMTALKLAAGLLTGSLGMLSEAAHSTLDLIAAAITLFSVQVSDKPADEDHNYGHGKVENLSAFVETFLMLVSCIWIVSEAVRRIFTHHLELEITIWPFLVLALSIVVDFSRARALQRVAQRHNSHALAADALHFSTDVWSSLAVMSGLAATWAGARWHIPNLELADPIAALVVSGIILRVTWKLTRRTVDELIDATPEATRRDLLRAISHIEGIQDVERLRVRSSGSKYFVDVSIGLARNLTFQRSEQLVFSATEAVQRILPEADVVVHTVPRATLAESIFDKLRAVASRANVSLHDVTVQEFQGKLRVEQHVEVDEKMTLQQAHDFISLLESNMLKEVPEIATILTHIESEPAQIAHPASLESDRALEAWLRSTAREFPQILDIHEVIVVRIGDHIQVSCHCTMPDDMPMAEVHEIITSFEIRFKLDCPEVYRVLIHPEPATDNRR